MPTRAPATTPAAIPSLADYAASRAALLAAAEEAGATVTSYGHPLAGPDGGPLATDVARFGAPIGEADAVVLLSSGLHGVEGHAGNGLQQLLVASGRLTSLPTRTAVALVHAVNPYGFAWSRRVDHENIDVNRNFLADYDHLPENPLYGRVDHLLNPSHLDLQDHTFLHELAAFWAEVGDVTMFKTVSGGQYDFPRGVQFGGQRATWSRQTLQRLWADQLAGARSGVELDIHTGLGPLGRLTVFQTADEHEAAAQRGAEWFPTTCFRSDRTGEAEAVDHGLMGPGFDAWAGDALETSAFVLEFGTHDPTQGVTVFRADNWLHQHGDPRSEVGGTIAAMMRDFFFVEDPAWRADVAEQGMAAIHAALDGITAEA